MSKEISHKSRESQRLLDLVKGLMVQASYTQNQKQKKQKVNTCLPVSRMREKSMDQTRFNSTSKRLSRESAVSEFHSQKPQRIQTMSNYQRDGTSRVLTQTVKPRQKSIQNTLSPRIELCEQMRSGSLERRLKSERQPKKSIHFNTKERLQNIDMMLDRQISSRATPTYFDPILEHRLTLHMKIPKNPDLKSNQPPSIPFFVEISHIPGQQITHNSISFLTQSVNDSFQEIVSQRKFSKVSQNAFQMSKSPKMEKFELLSKLRGVLQQKS